MSIDDSGRASGVEPTGGVQEPTRKPEMKPDWERGVLEKLALAAVTEQRRARRWNIFFRLVFISLAILFVVLGVGLWTPGGHPVGTGRHAALVELKGVIQSEGEASADLIIESLQAAFEDQGTAGVILRINSPGGSPVQAGIIHDEIRRLRGKFPDMPLHVVVEDVCASGGYYVAVAADRIFVDKASMVGSIRKPRRVQNVRWSSSPSLWKRVVC
jgi:protease-4